MEGNFVRSDSARPVSLNGEHFRRIRQAALHLKVARKTLTTMINEERDPNIFWLKKEEDILDESS